jgi:acetyl esterase/lipase
MAVLAALAATAMGGARDRSAPAGARAEVYKTVGDVELRLYIFAPGEHKASDRRPAIVFFFGGGWVGGSPKQFEHHARYFASRGMVAMTADYRVRNRHKTTPFECVADGKSAVRWVRANAGRLGIDPERIVASGGSAGGHVAAATAFLEGFDEPTEDAEISSKPNALVLFNPVIDTTPKGYGSKRLGEKARSLSPVHHVKPGAPPAIVFHGGADRTVPHENVERFRDEMKKAGNRCELVSFDGEGHGFFNYGRKGNKAFVATVRRADEFLASLGYLKGPPALEPPK